MLRRLLFTVVALLILQESAATNDAKCDAVGPRCNSKGTDFQMCLKVGDPPRLLRDCSAEGLRCREENKSVKCERDPSENVPKFECMARGEYPDVLDCKATYVCEDDTKPKKRCTCKADNHFVYPVMKLPCIPYEKCPRNDITCDMPGNVGNFVSLKNVTLDFGYLCKKKSKYVVYTNTDKESPFIQSDSKTCENL